MYETCCGVHEVVPGLCSTISMAECVRWWYTVRVVSPLQKHRGASRATTPGSNCLRSIRCCRQLKSEVSFSVHVRPLHQTMLTSYRRKPRTNHHLPVAGTATY